MGNIDLTLIEPVLLLSLKTIQCAETKDNEVGFGISDVFHDSGVWKHKPLRQYVGQYVFTSTDMDDFFKKLS